MSPSSKRPGEPAAADADPVFGEGRPEFVHVHREAAEGLHAGESSDARLTQAFLQADVVAGFSEIVVPPRDGGDSELGFQVL
jgi:hypothetical protein